MTSGLHQPFGFGCWRDSCIQYLLPLCWWTSDLRRIYCICIGKLFVPCLSLQVLLIPSTKVLCCLWAEWGSILITCSLMARDLLGSQVEKSVAHVLLPVLSVCGIYGSRFHPRMSACTLPDMICLTINLLFCLIHLRGSHLWSIISAYLINLQGW